MPLTGLLAPHCDPIVATSEVVIRSCRTPAASQRGDPRRLHNTASAAAAAAGVAVGDEYSITASSYDCDPVLPTVDTQDQRHRSAQAVKPAASGTAVIRFQLGAREPKSIGADPDPMLVGTVRRGSSCSCGSRLRYPDPEYQCRVNQRRGAAVPRFFHRFHRGERSTVERASVLLCALARPPPWGSGRVERSCAYRANLELSRGVSESTHVRGVHPHPRDRTSFRPGIRAPRDRRTRFTGKYFLATEKTPANIFRSQKTTGTPSPSPEPELPRNFFIATPSPRAPTV
jgi:hypothetical protein